MLHSHPCLVKFLRTFPGHIFPQASSARERPFHTGTFSLHEDIAILKAYILLVRDSTPLELRTQDPGNQVSWIALKVSFIKYSLGHRAHDVAVL
jgi:hypothetical protein